MAKDDPSKKDEMGDFKGLEADKSSTFASDDFERGNTNRGFQTEPDSIILNDLSEKEDNPSDDIVFEDKEYSGGFLGQKLETLWKKCKRLLGNKGKRSKLYIIGLAVLLYNIYFIAAIIIGIQRSERLDYCSDVGFLIIITVIVYVGLFYLLVIKRYFGHHFSRVYNKVQEHYRNKILQRLPEMCRFEIGEVIAAGILTSIIIYIIYDCRNDPYRLVSGFGIFVLLLLGFVFSKHPGYVMWRQVTWGIILQFILALLILRWPVGNAVFDCMGQKVNTFLGFTDEGSGFVFGYLVDRQPFISAVANSTLTKNTLAEINDTLAMKFVFMFKVLSVIYFFNFCISMLFYLGTMQWIVLKVGFILQFVIGTTACESVNASANIFLGQSEAPLLIRPYLPIMTRSEIHAVMTGGFATIAGTVLFAYINFGIDAAHLLTASVMSAPAALAFAKLFYPETKKSKTTTNNLIFPKSEDSNILDAASNGAAQAVHLVANIAGSLIAFLAFVAFVDSLLSWFGSLVDAPFLSFKYLLGLVFYPLAFVMGVECSEVATCCPQGDCGSDCDQCRIVATLVGLKTIVNEFAAYDVLAGYVRKGALSKRSEAIATFALCGFSNPASVGIQIATLNYMAPKRRGDISLVALRAFIAGSAACFLTACTAGLLLREPDNSVTPS